MSEREDTHEQPGGGEANDAGQMGSEGGTHSGYEDEDDSQAGYGRGETGYAQEGGEPGGEKPGGEPAEPGSGEEPAPSG